jgi:plastocyanin
VNEPCANGAGSTVRRTRRVGSRLLVLLILAFGALVFVAGSAGAATLDVSITDNRFAPPVVEIEAGDAVIWTNDGTTIHDVSADDGTFQSGPLSPGQTFSFTFQIEGTYVYRSTSDSNLTGSVTVGGAAIDSAQSASPLVTPEAPDQATASPETFAYTGAAETIALAVIGTIALLFGWAVTTGFGSPFNRLEPWRILALADPRRLGFTDELMPRGRWRRIPRRSRQADLLPGNTHASGPSALPAPDRRLAHASRRHSGNRTRSRR